MDNLKLWLDASDPSNFTLDANGHVLEWHDLSGNGRTATPTPALTSASVEKTVYGTVGLTNGVPAFKMGEAGSCIDLGYTRVTGIKTVFFVMDIQNSPLAFLLGDTSKYHFHRRGTDAADPVNAYFDANYADAVKGSADCVIRCDGVPVNPKEDVPPPGLHVYTLLTNYGSQSDRLTRDRTCPGRNGGRALSELLVFDTRLDMATVAAVEAQLAAKWLKNYTLDDGALTVGDGARVGIDWFAGEAIASVALGEGSTFDFADGQVQTLALTSLSLAGGATLKVDLFADGKGDSFWTDGLDLTGASAEHPVLVDFGSALTATMGTRTLISSGVSDGDAAKFALPEGSQHEASFFVENGALKVTFAATEPLRQGLAVYLPFSGTQIKNFASGSSVTPAPIYRNKSDVNASKCDVTPSGFNGKDGYLSLAHGGAVELVGSEKLAFQDDNKSFAIALWLRLPEKNSNYAVIFGNADWNSYSNSGFTFSSDLSSGNIGLNYVMNGGAQTKSNLFTPSYGKWRFYAVSRTSDGKLNAYEGDPETGTFVTKGEYDASAIQLSANRFYLGRNAENKYCDFNGDIDDFAFWTRGVSATDIQRIFEAGREQKGLGELLGGAYEAPDQCKGLLIHLDASDRSNFTFDEDGLVTAWRDLSGQGRDATVYSGAACGSVITVNGKSAYQMGAVGSTVDLGYPRMTAIHTVVLAMDIVPNSSGAFLLGDSACWHFHRGGSGQYLWTTYSDIAKDAGTTMRCDGAAVNLGTDYPPSGPHVYVLRTPLAGVISDQLTRDRSTWSSTAGRKLFEVMVYNYELSDAEVEELEAQLMEKWVPQTSAEIVWSPTDAANWDASTEAWLSEGERCRFANGANVLFNSAQTASAVITSAGVSPSNVTFTAATQAFTGGPVTATGTTKIDVDSTVTFGNVWTSARTENWSANVSFAGSFDAGQLLQLPGASFKAVGSGIQDFAFSVGEDDSVSLNETFLTRDGPDGVRLVKNGLGEAYVNLNAIKGALNGHANGRFVAAEGTTRVGGGAWGTNIGDILIEVGKGATCYTSGTHQFGGTGAQPRLVINEGGTMEIKNEQYFSAAGSYEDPIVWMKGDATLLIDFELRITGNPFYIRAEGTGNRILGRLSGGYNGNVTVSTAEGGDIVITNPKGSNATTILGPGVTTLGKFDGAGGTCTVEGGTLAVTKDFTFAAASLTLKAGTTLTSAGDDLAVIDDFSKVTFEDGATVDGHFAVTCDVPDDAPVFHGTFAITEAGKNCDYSKLKLDGTLELAMNTLKVPVGIDLANVDKIRVTGNGGFAAEGAYTLFEGLDEMPEHLPSLEGAVSDLENASWKFEDGKLELVITETPESKARRLLWRPASGVTDWLAGNAWSGPDGVTDFIGGYHTEIDGQEANYTGEISVTADVEPLTTDISGGKDYVLAGSGKVLGGPFTKSGSGTLTLNGAGIGDTHDVTLNGGTVVLGEGAGETALGSRAGGKVVVGEGATFDLNYNQGDANVPARNNITHRKLFELAGGTVKNGGSPTYAAFGDVKVTADSVLGDGERFDWRNYGSDPDCNKAPTLTGGEDVTLTVENTKSVGLVGTQVSIGRIDVRNGGVLRPETQSTTLDVPKGINVYSGSTLQYYNTTIAAPVNVPEGQTSSLDANNSTSYENGKLTVGKDATAQFVGGSAIYWNGPVENNGTIRMQNGYHRLNGPYSGTGAITQTGGYLYFSEGFTNETPVTVSAAGNVLFVGDMESGHGAPAAPKLTITGKPNYTWFATSFATTLDAAGITFNETQPRLLWQSGVGGDAAAAEKKLTIRNLKATTDRVSIGMNSTRRAYTTLTDGTDLTAKDLYLGDEGSSPAVGDLTLAGNAKVKVTEYLRIGHWSGIPTDRATHRLALDSDEAVLDASGIDTHVGYDSPEAVLDLRRGLMKTKGLVSTRTSREPTTDGRCRYVHQTGGTLELGASGLNFTKYLSGNDWLDFAGGTLRSTAAWGTTRNFDLFFGRDPADAGTYVFEMGGNLINLQTAMKGYSDVVIRGTANFNGQSSVSADQRAQGVVMGRWTVESTGKTSLYGIRRFNGGLTLASGANVAIGVNATNVLTAAVGGGNGAATLNAVPLAGFATFVDAPMTAYPQSRFSTGPFGSTGFAFVGQFKVEEEDAGVWTFAGNYDDQIVLTVDGTTVFSTSSYTEVGRGTVELAAGWHLFRISIYDGSGAAGPGSSNWSGGKALGFVKGESSSTSGNDYTAFTPENVEMRQAPTVEFSTFAGNRTSGNWDTMEDYASTEAITTLAYLHDNTDLAHNSGHANRYRGYFKADRGGAWTFRVNYDDRIQLSIDGKTVARGESYTAIGTGTVTLTPGWHAFDIRCADGSGGYGPNKLSGAAVLVTPPDGTETRFDENLVPMVASAYQIPDPGVTDVALAGGSTLTSDGALPFVIEGELSGSGSLKGNFAFSEDAALAVKVDGRDVETVDVEGVTNADFLKLLKEIRLEIGSNGASRQNYVICNAGSLTAEQAAAIRVTVTGATKPGDWTVRIKDGKIADVNPHPAGSVIFIR